MNRNVVVIATLTTLILIAGVVFAFQVLRPMQRDVAAMKSMLAVAVDSPDEVAKKLQEFETRLSDESSWPATSDAAQALLAEYDKFTTEAGPYKFLSADLRSRYASTRWGIESLATVVALHNLASADEFNDVEGACQSLLDNAPNQSAPFQSKIRSHLAQELQAARTKNQAEQKQLAEQKAQQTLDGQGDLESAWKLLEPFKDDSKISELRGSIQQRLLENRVKDNLEQFRKDLDIANASPNANLRQIGAARVLQQAAELYFTLAQQQPRPDKQISLVQSLLEESDKRLKSSAEQLQKVANQKSREYQKWALEQILAFDGPDGWQYDESYARITVQLNSFADAKAQVDWRLLQLFPSAREVIRNDLGVDISGIEVTAISVDQQKQIYNKSSKSFRKDIAYRTTRDGMVKFLLPINVGLLDPPVAHFYNKAYDRAWKILGEHGDDQLFVAKSAAVIKKNNLEDF